MAIWANPIWIWLTGNNLWSSNLWASIRTWVVSWEELSKAAQEKRTTDYFAERQKANNDITTWKITSGNPAQDTITVRKTNLVNLFAADALERWANPDKVMAITKKPDEVLKRLTSLWQQQADAINDYLMKGWYADRVFDYVMWNSKNPYTKKDEDANNYIWWVKSVPEQTAGTLLDLANKWLSKIWLTSTSEEQNKKDYENYHNLTSKMSTEEYNQYKEWNAGKWYDKLFNTWIYSQEWAFNEQGQSFVNWWLMSRADMYDAYDKAVADWFDWSVEDYANYMDSMAAKVTGGIADAIQREIDNTYDTESWAFKAGKVSGDILEFITTPELRLAKLPKAWKYVEKATERWLESFPKVTKRIKWLWQWLEQWVKMQALEDAYNNELSSAEKYIITAWINAAVWGTLDWLWSLIKSPAKLIWNPRGAAKTAIWNKTTAEWDEMTKITKNALKDPNAEITPYTKLAELLKQARKKLIGNRVESGKALQKTRQKLQFKEWEKYTLKDLETQLNDRLKSLSRYSSQWKWKWAEESVPKISFEWGKLNIENVDKLNLFSRVEWTAWNSKTINLWDKIKNIRDSTIWVGKKPNATTMEQFLRKLKSEVHQSYQWWEDNMIKVLRDWVDKAWNKFNKKLTSNSKTSLKEGTATSAWDINLANTFDDLIGSLEWDIYSAWAAQWATRTTEATKQLFKAINKATNGKIDMNNEINAWLANIALYWDKNSAMALLDTIYPSVPWMYEFFIKNFIWSMKKSGARRATKDYAQQAAKTYNEWTTIVWDVWDNIRNNAKWWENIVGWETYIQSE